MNGGTWPTYRTVVLDFEAQAFTDANTQVTARFDEQWDGIIWLLSRTPDIGLPRNRQEPNKDVLYVVAGNDAAGTKEVWLLYSYTEDEVTIHAARFGDEHEPY